MDEDQDTDISPVEDEDAETDVEGVEVPIKEGLPAIPARTQDGGLTVKILDSGRLTELFITSWDDIRWILKQQDADLKLLELQLRGIGTYY